MKNSCISPLRTTKAKDNIVTFSPLPRTDCRSYLDMVVKGEKTERQTHRQRTYILSSLLCGPDADKLLAVILYMAIRFLTAGP